MTLDLIKIYGERNSGTNYLEQVLELNFDLRLAAGNYPVSHHALYRAIGLVLPDERAFRVIEGLRDGYDHRHFDRSLGWKHAQVPVQAGGAGYPPGTGFLTLTKNPFAWLVSLYRRPYSNRKYGSHRGKVVPATGTPFSEFIRAPWPTVGRENGPEEYSNPVSMWGIKTASYFNLGDIGPHLHLRYEDLLTDFDDTLRLIGKNFDAPLRHAEPVDVAQDSKGSKKSKADYATYYVTEAWRKNFSEDDLAFVSSQLDPELMARLGYRFPLTAGVS